MVPQHHPPPALKRSNSGESQSSYASAATTVSRSSSKLLFGEIPLTPATTVDGRSVRSNNSICNLVLSTSSVFLRFWLNDSCRDNLLTCLDQDDLASMRLVCHDFSSRAAPTLFQSITTTFKTSTFSKPARVEALSRVGRLVKTFTFHMPHTAETLLPPIVDPATGSERQFIYEPQIQNPHSGPAKDKAPKYGSWEMQDLLIKQYPPLFHAATNVPAFVAALSELSNLTHLKVSCPGHNAAPRHCRSVVDYALISLRIAVERAPLYSLCSLSLHPIHAGGLLYLHPMHGFGSTATSARRWGQIRSLSICMDSIPFPSSSPSSPSARTRAQALQYLRTLHAYLLTLSRSLTRLFFRWKGPRGPSPLSLATEPCMLSTTATTIHMQNTHPSLRTADNTARPSTSTSSSSDLQPLTFSRLEYMDLENAVMDSTQISEFIRRHRRSLVCFTFEDVKLREGNWDDALEPLTEIAGSDGWKGSQVEVMDVPIMFPSVSVLGDDGRGGVAPKVCEEPRIMGCLMEDEDGFSRAGGQSQGVVQPPSHPRSQSHPHSHTHLTQRSPHALSRWLSKPTKPRTPKKTPIAVPCGSSGKEGFFAGDHVKRLLRLGSWK